MRFKPLAACLVLQATGCIGLAGCGSTEASSWAPPPPIPHAFCAHISAPIRLTGFPRAPGFVVGCSIPVGGTLRSMGLGPAPVNGMCMSRVHPLSHPAFAGFRAKSRTRLPKPLRSPRRGETAKRHDIRSTCEGQPPQLYQQP